MEDNLFKVEHIWNSKLSVVRDEAPYPRNYIRASEMGKPFIDRYLAMTGVKPSNPFPERLLRVFDCGNIFEGIVMQIFKDAGILHPWYADEKKQPEVNVPEENGLLKVTGHVDAIIGGNTVDWQVQRNLVLDDEDKPDWLRVRSLRFIDALEAEWGFNPIPELVYEIKSVHSMSFHYMLKNGAAGFEAAYPHHIMQLVTYMIGLNKEEGRLFYVSKDDLTIFEVVVKMTPELHARWSEDRRIMSEYYAEKKLPPEEPVVMQDPFSGKWKVNYKAKGMYLTHITGMSEDEFDQRVKEELKALNKGLKKTSKDSAEEGGEE